MLLIDVQIGNPVNNADCGADFSFAPSKVLVNSTDNLCESNPCDMSKASDKAVCCIGTAACTGITLPPNVAGQYDEQLIPIMGLGVSPTSWTNATWGTCATPGTLQHGDTCMISCDEGYNTSSIGLSCDNGVLSGVAGCFYDPGPRTGWVEIGHWVIYDIEDTQVYGVSSADHHCQDQWSRYCSLAGLCDP